MAIMASRSFGKDRSRAVGCDCTRVEMACTMARVSEVVTRSMMIKCANEFTKFGSKGKISFLVSLSSIHSHAIKTARDIRSVD